MANGVTNRGKKLILELAFRNSGISSQFYVALITSGTTPTVDINTFSELTEIAAGNGYTSGGIAVARNSTDFDTLTEDDTNDWATALIKDLVWTASGGPIPSSGSSPSYWVLLTDEVTVGNRQVIAWGDVSPTTAVVSAGQTLTISDAGVRLKPPA